MIRPPVVDMGLILAKHMKHEDEMVVWLKNALLLPDEITFMELCIKRRECDRTRK
jgi:hypothetical protein